MGHLKDFENLESGDELTHVLSTMRFASIRSRSELQVVKYNPRNNKNKVPDILRTKAFDVSIFNKNTEKLLNVLKKIMIINRGVGIAAPQIGVPARIVIARINWHQVELINPEIVEIEGSRLSIEGCISVEGMKGIVKRPRRITVKAQNKNGENKIIRVKGFSACLLSHEIDHLDGVLYTDKAIIKF